MTLAIPHHLSATVGWLLIVAVVLTLTACAGGGGESTEGEGESVAPGTPGSDDTQEEQAGDDEPGDGEEATADSSLTPLPRRTIEIYFPSQVEEGLVSEYREIFATATSGDQIKQVIADLITGPTAKEATRALPAGTRLRQAYVLEGGVAWLDFSSDLTQGIGGGSSVEVLTVYSIVNSVVANVSDVRRVGILVNGRPVATLNGHMHLLRPLRPNFSLILGSITVSGPRPAERDLDLVARGDESHFGAD